MVVLGSALCWVGLLNFRWHRRLAAAPVLATLVEDSDDTPPRRRGFRISLRQTLALVAALSAVLAGVTSGYRDIPPQLAMHVAPEEARLDLPAGATDVCIWRGSRGTIAYNFAVDEAGFWEWTETTGGSLESQASGVTIQPIIGSFDVWIVDPSVPTNQHTIKRGWYYDWHEEDRRLQYAYDADQGRAYFSFHAY